MNKKITISIFAVASVIIIVIILSIIIKGNKLGSGKTEDEYWIAYFAPSYTSISYGNTDAQIIKIDKLGNVEIYEEKAYPFSQLINYKDKVLYQSNKGIVCLNSKNNMDNVVSDKNTVGYNMADILENKDLFYFLLNEAFKDDYYSSNIIIGNEEKQTLHQIEGFVNSYGDDGENIYLNTSDMKNKYYKQIQKISINGQEDISIKKNDIILDTIINSNNKIIVEGGYIYNFCVKEHHGISMLKISSDTLELESVSDLIKFDLEEDNDKFYPISPSSIFYNQGKIYYPMLGGEVYSFDIKSNKFIKEFSIKDYRFNVDTNILSFYSNTDSEIYFLYYDKERNKYCLNTYSLEGGLKDKIYLDKLNVKSKNYPHSFIKSK